MKKILSLLLLTATLQSYGQDCFDTTATYGDCSSCSGLDFSPVCGCDGKNYRTECEAFNCAHLLRDSSNTICDYVEFDLRPTFIGNTTAFQTSTTAKICVYMKYSGSAVIQVYNVFGKIMSEVSLTAIRDNVFLPGNHTRGVPPEYLEISGIANFERGVYIVVVFANSQIKSKKILKI